MASEQILAETLSSSEVHELERVVRARAPRFLRLPGRLESLYQQQIRSEASRTRLVLTLLPWLICGSSPLWGPSMFDLPDALAQWMETIEFRVIVPMFIVLSLVQWRYEEREVSEWLLLTGFLVVCLLVEWMRYKGATYGWRLEPLLTSTMPIAVIALSRIRIVRMLAFIAAYFGVILFADYLFQHPIYQRSPSTWLAEWILLAIMAISFTYAQYARRRAWAYSMIFRAQAGTDPLTGLKNRRALELQYEQVCAVLKRHPAPISLIAIDVDHFKLINDSYGHAYGDGVLTAFAGRLSQFAQRPLDAAVRLGGDEFVLLLPECDATSAQRIAQHVIEGIRTLALDNRESPYRVLTTSAGVATASGNPPLWELLRKADAALYRAKSRGRNCAVGFEAGMLETRSASPVRA